MDEEFKVCVRCKSEFEGEGEMCETCMKEKEEEDLEEGVDRNER
jgi:hypothetical protein